MLIQGKGIVVLLAVVFGSAALHATQTERTASGGAALQAHYDAAERFQKQGDLDKALADYDHASQLDPTYAAAYFSRGRIFEKKDDIARARDEYNKAIAVPTKDRIAQWAQDNARARLQALAEPKK